MPSTQRPFDKSHWSSNLRRALGPAVPSLVIRTALASLAFGYIAFASGDASADDRFAVPPGGAPRAAIVPDGEPASQFGARPTTYDYYEPPSRPPLAVAYRAPLRFELGPSFITSGTGVGYGLSGGLSLGTGTIGGRFSASFYRGEGGDTNDKNALTGVSTAQYLAELVLDLKKNGSLHPIVAMGMGIDHVDKGGTSGEAGIGTGRVGLEYQFAVDDADVRAGASLLGALTGPASDEVKDLKAYGIFDLHVAVGF